jgi:hypothetical protein
MSRPLRFSVSSTAVRLFITCWLVYALHFATNTVREIYPALSLGDHLSFNVQEYSDLHPDIFHIPGRGAFINNNPGASILGAIPYALARPIIDRIVVHVQHARAKFSEPAREYQTIYPLAKEFHRKSRERGLDIKFGLAAGVMQVFCMAPVSALSAVLMFYILVHLIRSPRKALLLSFLYAFATPVFYRTGHLNHNLLVGHFTFFAFALLWRPWDAPSYQRRPRYLLAGLLCGWTVVLDFSGIISVFALSIYCLVRRNSLVQSAKSRFDLLHFFVGIGLSSAVLVGYQWSCFGNPFLPAQHYMPPAEFTEQGYRGFDWPQLDLLWKTAFGMRYGLFTSAPLLILSLYIPGWLRNSARIVSGLETRFIALLCLSFFVFCSANKYGRMQFNCGVRHIVPVTPFLFLIIAGVLIKMPTFWAIALGTVGTYWLWCLAMYRDVEQRFGVFESLIHITSEGFELPWLTTLNRMGHLAKQPTLSLIFLACGIAILAIWAVKDPFKKWAVANSPTKNDEYKWRTRQRGRASL